jgi:hypothetical protein
MHWPSLVKHTLVTWGGEEVAIFSRDTIVQIDKLFSGGAKGYNTEQIIVIAVKLHETWLHGFEKKEKKTSFPKLDFQQLVSGIAIFRDLKVFF